MDHVCCQHKTLKWLIKQNSSNVSPVKSICLFVAGVDDNCEQIMIITPLWEADGSQWGSMATFHCHFWYFVSDLPQGCLGCKLLSYLFIGIKYINYIQSLVVSLLHNFISNQHVHGTLYLSTLLFLCKLCGISLFASEMVGEMLPNGNKCY